MKKTVRKIYKTNISKQSVNMLEKELAATFAKFSKENDWETISGQRLDVFT